MQYSLLQCNVVIRESFLFRYSVIPYSGFYCVSNTFSSIYITYNNNVNHLHASWLHHKAFASLTDWINLCQVICKNEWLITWHVLSTNWSLSRAIVLNTMLPISPWTNLLTTGDKMIPLWDISGIVQYNTSIPTHTHTKVVCMYSMLGNMPHTGHPALPISNILGYTQTIHKLSVQWDSKPPTTQLPLAKLLFL